MPRRDRSEGENSYAVAENLAGVRVKLSVGGKKTGWGGENWESSGREGLVILREIFGVWGFLGVWGNLWCEIFKNRAIYQKFTNSIAATNVAANEPQSAATSKVAAI